MGRRPVTLGGKETKEYSRLSILVEMSTKGSAVTALAVIANTWVSAAVSLFEG